MQWNSLVYLSSSRFSRQAYRADWQYKQYSLVACGCCCHRRCHKIGAKAPLIARLMGPTWGPSGADRTHVGPMLASWTLLSGSIKNRGEKSKRPANIQGEHCSCCQVTVLQTIRLSPCLGESFLGLLYKSQGAYLFVVYRRCVMAPSWPVVNFIKIGDRKETYTDKNFSKRTFM